MIRYSFLRFNVGLIIMALTCQASDIKNISVVVVNQPSMTKIIFKDKTHVLPTVIALIRPYNEAILTKEYTNGDKEILGLHELPSAILSFILKLVDNDITNLRGIVNVTPRMFILYGKLTDLFFQLLEVPFHPVEVKKAPIWHYFW